jgi:alkanesulfonate monooxygenase SsuD/methylene tetrahydromethanopterin reductase-like flavin-dependent oxidoreductase (luciferase family)
MRLGLHIPSTNWTDGAAGLGSKLAEVVQAAESAGFETIDVADHIWGHPATGGVEAGQIEAYTTLGFIAAHTRRVRLMALATAVSYRHAGLLAKMVTTLDVLSGGRAMLGIGAGDYAVEASVSWRKRCRRVYGCGRGITAPTSLSLGSTFDWSAL